MVSRVLLPLLLSVSLPASAATFTVTSGADSGAGTLRQAIVDANANPGADEIRFAVASVSLTSTLPEVIDQVTIDGSVGAARVVIAGPGGTNIIVVFRFEGGSQDSILRNVRVEGVRSPVILATEDVTVEDSSLEGLNDSLSAVGHSNLIQRNTIQGRTTIHSRENELYENEVVRLRLFEFAADNQIGATGRGNTIRGQLTIQYGGGNVVEGNTLTENLLNVTRAISVEQPEGGMRIIGNTIRNYQTGVMNGFGRGVEILGNSIVVSGLAVDLNGDGATPNDPAPDADEGANELQNFPLLTSAERGPASLTVTGTLTSAPLTPYRIELFSNDASNPDMRTFLGGFDVTTDAAGNAVFTHTAGSPLPAVGDVITSTATNRGSVATPGNSPLSTSEVSAPVAVTAAASLAGVPTLSTWALIMMVLGLAWIGLRR